MTPGPAWTADEMPGVAASGRGPSPQPGGRHRRAGPGPTVLPQRLETDAEAVERDLMKLVLTVVELVRQLMEKQALRRVD